MPSPGGHSKFSRGATGGRPKFFALGCRGHSGDGPLLEDGRQFQKAKDEEDGYLKELKIRPHNCYSRTLTDPAVTDRLNSREMNILNIHHAMMKAARIDIVRVLTFSEF